MRIAMMGAGGIGGYVGARLAQAGGDVSFIARGAHLAAMLQTGLRIQSDLGSFVLAPVSASEAAVDIAPVDLVIFAVKLYDSEGAAASLAPLVGVNTRVVTLQNGIDSVEILSRHLPRDHVIGGATYLSGFISKPGEVVHSGGLPQILVGGQHDPVIEQLRELCDRAIGLELKPVADIDEVLWEKFVTLCAFSGGTSLMRSGIGPILADPESRIFIEQLRDEGMAVAAAAGHPMADGFPGRVETRWSAFPPHVKSSMANDLERGKPIEVAWLSGRMHQLGLQLGVVTPGHTRRCFARCICMHRGRSARIPISDHGHSRIYWEDVMAGSSNDTMLVRAGDDTVGSQDMFNKELQTYRKIVGANLMFHREVYGVLRDLLVEHAPASFRFLDIACGDASASAAMLRTMAIGNYVGIDLSEASLRLAARELDGMPCPVELQCNDFAQAMAKWSEPVDVIWIGMSLHHLPATGKAQLMQDARRSLGGKGLFIIWEPALFEGEDRLSWLARFSLLRDEWSAVSDEEFASMERHMHLADFPETVGTWLGMGTDAGFSQAEEIFMMPNKMGRVFRFSN